MKKPSILDKIINTPDELMRDDDHLDRPELTEEEATEAFAELAEKLKKQKPIKAKKVDFGQATIDALNELYGKE